MCGPVRPEQFAATIKVTGYHSAPLERDCVHVRPRQLAGSQPAISVAPLPSWRQIHCLVRTLYRESDSLFSSSSSSLSCLHHSLFLTFCQPPKGRGKGKQERESRTLAATLKVFTRSDNITSKIQQLELQNPEVHPQTTQKHTFVVTQHDWRSFISFSNSPPCRADGWRDAAMKTKRNTERGGPM